MDCLLWACSKAETPVESYKRPWCSKFHIVSFSSLRTLMFENDFPSRSYSWILFAIGFVCDMRSEDPGVFNYYLLNCEGRGGGVWAPKVTLSSEAVTLFHILLHVVRVKAHFYEPECTRCWQIFRKKQGGDVWIHSRDTVMSSIFMLLLLYPTGQ